MKQFGSKEKRWLLSLALAILGGLGGWLYYRFVGCATGACPLASRPGLMIVYGVVMGLLLGYLLSPRPRDPEGER